MEAVIETGDYATVHNLRVEDFQTYFVGDSTQWGWSVWAHTTDCVVTEENGEHVVRNQGVEEFRGDSVGLRAFWRNHPEHNLLASDGQRLWLPVVPETQLQNELDLGRQWGVKPTPITGPESLAPFANQGEPLIWVRTMTGEMLVHPENIDVGGVPQKVFHTQLSGGEPVLAAGQMNGVRQRAGFVTVAEMNDDSGHHFSPQLTTGMGRTHEPKAIYKGLEQSWVAMEGLNIRIIGQYGDPQ